MANSRSSFEALYRANQERAEDREEPAAESGGSTIPLTEALGPPPFEFRAELAEPEPPAPDLGSTGSFFERKPRDLGGKADPNQESAANPYDSRMGEKGRALPRLPGRR